MAKVMISIPDKLLKVIDKAAKNEYETRSSFIREKILESFSDEKEPRNNNTDQLFKALDKASKLKWNFPDGVEYVRSIRGNWEKGAPKD